MKFLKSSVLFISMACIVPVCSIAREKSERITRAEIEQKSADEFINGLMSRMTVDEKIGQLNLPSYGNVMPNPKKSEIASRIVRGEVGGIFNIFGVDAIRQLQEVAVKESRLGIPIIVGADICNGYKTVFPIPLGLSCSWKPENIEEVARISAKEVGADGICWTYSPMVDISHDARWGRVKEGAGEDPFLGGIMAQAWVRGYQGNDLSADTTLMACVKHYALYGAAEAGRDYNTVDMSRVTAMNYYMRPYQAAVEAGVGSIMTSFNEFESIPATGNTWLLNDVLRKQWGFNGFVVSDFTAIAEMVNHGIGNSQEVGVKALKAGVDMDMIADCYHAVLKKSLEEGKITEAEIDSACRRILISKYQLGLFHDPAIFALLSAKGPTTATLRHPLSGSRLLSFLSNTKDSAAIRRAADTLFTDKNSLAALFGLQYLYGSWKYDEQTKSYHGLVEDLQESLGNGVEVVFAKGSNLVDDSVYEANFTDQNRSTRDDRSDEQLIAEALKVAEGADVIIAALGESIDMSGEGASRAILEMPQTQKKLLDAIQKTGKPIVMVLFTGRPLALQSEEKQVNAILNVWFGGTEAGAAIADVLTGKVSPTGKLTMSFPRVTGQCPIYYNHKMTGRPMSPDAWYTRYVSNYIDVLNEPLYPFGYGLSYTTYTYGDVSLNTNSMDANGKIQASVIVTNTGAQDGEEIVQLYLRDIVRSITPPVQELKGFKRVALKAGESKKVTFDIDVDMLKFYDSTLDYVAEPGEFQVMIGGNSKEVKTASFTLK